VRRVSVTNRFTQHKGLVSEAVLMGEKGNKLLMYTEKLQKDKRRLSTKEG